MATLLAAAGWAENWAHQSTGSQEAAIASLIWLLLTTAVAFAVAILFWFAFHRTGQRQFSLRSLFWLLGVLSLPMLYLSWAGPMIWQCASIALGSGK